MEVLDWAQSIIGANISLSPGKLIRSFRKSSKTLLPIRSSSCNRTAPAGPTNGIIYSMPITCLAMGNRLLYPNISPINSFRLIFNHYFQANYPMQEDK